MTAKIQHMNFDFQFVDSDVVNPHEYANMVNTDGSVSRQDTTAWLLHDSGYTLAIVFADCEQTAVDEAVDAGKLDKFLVAPEDLKDYGDTDEEQSERLSYLGNACEAFDIESLGIFEIPLPAFSFVALTVAAANDLAYEEWKVDAKKTARLERDLRFRNQMIEAAQQGIRQGDLARAQACLDRALNYKWEEAPVTSDVEARYERTWKEAEYHTVRLNEPVRVEIKGEETS